MADSNPWDIVETAITMATYVDVVLGTGVYGLLPEDFLYDAFERAGVPVEDMPGTAPVFLNADVPVPRDYESAQTTLQGSGIFPRGPVLVGSALRRMDG